MITVQDNLNVIYRHDVSSRVLQFKAMVSLGIRFFSGASRGLFINLLFIK